MAKFEDYRDIKNFSWVEFLRSYWYFIGDYKRKFILLSLLLFVIHFYQVVPPLILGRIVDIFTADIKPQDITEFYILAIVLGLSLLIVALFRLNTKKLLGDLRAEISYKVRVKGFEKLLSFSTKWHETQVTGEKVQKIQNGVTSLNILGRIISNEVMQALTSFIAVIVIFIFLKPFYVLFFVAYFLFFLVTFKYFYRRILIINENYYIALEKAGGSYVEGLSNILTLKTLGAGKNFTERVAEKEELTKKYDIKLRHIWNNWWKTFQVLNGIATSAFLIIVGRDVIAGAVTAGTIIVFFGYFQNLRNSSSELMTIFNDIVNCKAGIARMVEIFKYNEDRQFGNKHLPKQWGSINLINAGFYYKSKEKGNFHISNVNLNIDKYSKIGLVGKTGSGKSTLSKILAGLYKLEEGQYLIGNKNFYNFSYEEITNEIFMVLQESEMFNLTLKENVTLMRRVNKNMLEKAIRVSQLTDVIAKLPEGLETVIGERGYKLSGGERQRIGIARAIYRNPQIFIFDEATSSLDSKTEEMVVSGIVKELQEKTIISVAHRVSTLKDYDKLYVFKEGEIVEEGSFEDLVNNKDSHFYELYSRQSS